MDKSNQRLMDMCTPEMCTWFYQRTEQHIKQVQFYAEKVINFSDEWNYKYYPLKYIAEKHDYTKYLDDHIYPYILLSWKHKCQNEKFEFIISDEAQEVIKKSTAYHVFTERHHPEFYIQHNNLEFMPDLYLAEMVCDWCAMSYELKNNPYDWANKTIGIRPGWNFTQDQRNKIYEFLSIWNI